MEKQRVNIDIDKELWKLVSIKAIEEGIQKRQLVETALDEYVNKKQKKEEIK